MRRGYFHQLAIAADQLLNALLAGYADETLSSRAWRCRNEKRRWRVMVGVIDRLFFWQHEHCKTSYLRERGGGHLPQHYAKDCVSAPTAIE